MDLYLRFINIWTLNVDQKTKNCQNVRVDKGEKCGNIVPSFTNIWFRLVEAAPPSFEINLSCFQSTGVLDILNWSSWIAQKKKIDYIEQISRFSTFYYSSWKGGVISVTQLKKLCNGVRTRVTVSATKDERQRLCLRIWKLVRNELLIFCIILDSVQVLRSGRRHIFFAKHSQLWLRGYVLASEY